MVVGQPAAPVNIPRLGFRDSGALVRYSGSAVFWVSRCSV